MALLASLRVRLVLILIAVAGGGLLVAGIVTTRSIEDFLIGRVDRQLQLATPGVMRVLGYTTAGRGNPEFERVILAQTAPAGSFTEMRAGDGRVRKRVVAGADTGVTAPAGIASGDVVTVQASNGEAYRVRASTPPKSTPPTAPGDQLITGIPIGTTDAVLVRLVRTDLVVGGIVLLIIVVIALPLVTAVLRPLSRIEDAAVAIADGDLDVRIPASTADRPNEVGRVAATLNLMLDRVDDDIGRLRDSERRLERFAADASHELRTPLTSILGSAGLIRLRGALTEQADTDALSRIEANGARMEALVAQLLTLAQSDPGTPRVDARCDLRVAASEGAELLADISPAHPVTIEGPDHVMAVADSERVMLVVNNLVSNVAAHTPEGTNVRISCGEDQDRAWLEVRDDGPGMSAEDAPRAFDRFYRADEARQLASGGFGLGLSIVQALVEADDGSVRLDTRSGHGLTVRCAWPPGDAAAASPGS